MFVIDTRILYNPIPTNEFTVGWMIVQEKNQDKFISNVVNSKDNEPILASIARRTGKTYTINKLAERLELLREKQGQVIRRNTAISIRKETQIVLIDDFSTELILQIQKHRPDIKIVGVSSGYPDNNEFELVMFE